MGLAQPMNEKIKLVINNNNIHSFLFMLQCSRSEAKQ
jgi:hypothetical protein